MLHLVGTRVSESYCEFQVEGGSQVANRIISLLVSLVNGPKDLQRKGLGSASILGGLFSNSM